jgi:hypothetical protein
MLCNSFVNPPLGLEPPLSYRIEWDLGTQGGVSQTSQYESKDETRISNRMPNINEMNKEQLKKYAERKEKECVQLEIKTQYLEKDYQKNLTLLYETEEFATRQQRQKSELEKRIKELEERIIMLGGERIKKLIDLLAHY